MGNINSGGGGGGGGRRRQGSRRSHPPPPPPQQPQPEIRASSYVFAAATPYPAPYPNPSSGYYHHFHHHPPAGYYVPPPPPPPPSAAMPMPLPAPYDHHHQAPNWADAAAGRYPVVGPPVMGPPAPYVEHQKAVTIRNDVNLKKETLRVEPDDENPGKFLVTFIFDATVAGSMQPYTYGVAEVAQLCSRP